MMNNNGNLVSHFVPVKISTYSHLFISRVRGLQGIRVIDSSVMPHVTSGNTNAPVVMIAEKGADMIKRDNAQPSLKRNIRHIAKE